jgi:hypothetical protein
MRGRAPRRDLMSVVDYYLMLIRRASSDWWRFIRARVVWPVAVGIVALALAVLLGATDAGWSALLPLLAVAVLAVAGFLRSLVLAPVRSFRELETERVGAETQLRRFEEGAPRLSFGRAVIPERSESLYRLALDEQGRRRLHNPALKGRVIRVPVTNQQGAEEARRVHARLNFLPDDTDGSFSPRHPAQGEWADTGETEIDLPGNGHPRLLDIVLVRDGPYPHAFEWTKHSRAAGLNGYEIKARPFDVEVEVMGSGPGPTAPHLRDTLRIDCRDNHMIVADWVSAGPDEPTNWVPWTYGGA